MNRRIAGISLLLAVAVAAILVSGCNRGTTTGPLPPPGTKQAAQSVVTTTEAMPTEVVGTVVAGATATVASATEPPPVVPTEIPVVVINTPVPLVATPVPGATSSYTVKPGDRLFSIGRQFGVNPYEIAQANRIGPPYTIYPGQVLVIPGGGGVTPVPGTETTYVVKPGDTIYSIGRKLGKSPIAIINANNLVNPNYIFPGQVLKIP